ncbi:MAG: hypothetical protein RIS70_2476 [Planctomycetota bacterium]|jgi:hypothetical protein
MSIRGIRLIQPTDIGYRRFLNYIRTNQCRSEMPDPLASAYNKSLLRWEKYVKQILADRFPRCEKRILNYRESLSCRRERHCYREIDFIAGNPERPDFFVEIKLRERSTSNHGWRQLGQSLHVARKVWPQLRGVVVYVEMSGILRLPCIRRSDITELDRLSACDFETNAERPVVWLRGEDVAAYAVDQGFATREEIAELPRIREEMHDPLKVLNVKSPIPDRSPFQGLLARIAS